MTRLQSDPTDQHVQSRNKKRIRLEIILVSLIAMAFVAAVGYQLSIQPHASLGSNQNLSPESWMVKGAYAKYLGQVDTISVPVNITGKIQVTDLNATHVQVQTDMKISTTFAPAVADRTIQWIDKTNVIFQPKGETLAKTYDTRVDVAGLGTRSCIAYDYMNEAINATYYLDKSLQWPVKIIYHTSFENQTYKIELNLSQTNIAELQTRQ